MNLNAPSMRPSSSSEGEISDKTCTKRGKTCYMHITSVKKEQIQEFLAKRWDTFKNCVERWHGLSGESAIIAENDKHCLTIDFDNVPEDAGFHATCYRRFIDKKRLGAAEKHSFKTAFRRQWNTGRRVCANMWCQQHLRISKSQLVSTDFSVQGDDTQPENGALVHL